MFDIESILAETITQKVVEKGLSKVNDLINKQMNKISSEVKESLEPKEYNFFKENYNLEISEDLVLSNIKNNLQAADMWADEISFSSAISSKKLQNIFVDIDLYLAPLNTRFDIEEKIETISSKFFLEDFEKNKVIYGGPGAGKTTLVKKIYNDYLGNQSKYNFFFPIVIRFREIDYQRLKKDKPHGFFKILADILGIHIDFPPNYMEKFDLDYNDLLANTIIAFLNDCKVLLILDGFDEIPKKFIKSRIESDLKRLSLSLQESKFILTSRTNDFLLNLTNCETFEICSLDDIQIKLLINKWIVNKTKADDLFEKIKMSPYYDTTMRPLTLSHLCAIYERRKTIPPKPRYIYDFVLHLLLEFWDQQRSIVRASDYADFYIEKKKEFLANLSYWLTAYLGKNVFNSDDIRMCYKKIHKSHNLPASQAKKVVQELENHTGIFVQTGFNSFQFSHKSMQEFLSAKHMSLAQKVPKPSVLINLPNETAILVSLSSFPNYFFELFNKNFKKYHNYFWNTFFDRLIEEKPDFNQDPSVIIFFLNNIWQNENLIFRKYFLLLLENTNLKVGIKSFYKLYNSEGTFTNYSSFLYKDLSKKLAERSYYPARIYIKSELFKKMNQV